MFNELYRIKLKHNFDGLQADWFQIKIKINYYAN